MKDNTCHGNCFLEKNLNKTSDEKQGNKTNTTDNTLTIHLAAQKIFIKNILNDFRNYKSTSDRIIASRTILPEKLPPKSFLFIMNS